MKTPRALTRPNPTLGPTRKKVGSHDARDVQFALRQRSHPASTIHNKENIFLYLNLWLSSRDYQSLYAVDRIT